MVSLITMNNKLLEDDNYFIIKNIKFLEIDKNIYDNERNTYLDKTDRTTNFKIISILVTNNADIINISK